MSSALPHPGPLPLGEGEPSAVSRKTDVGIGQRLMRVRRTWLAASLSQRERD